MWLTIVKDVIKGLFAGALASFIGYAKKEEVPQWDLKKMLQTVFVGAFTNSIIVGTGMPITDLAVEISTWLEVPALTAPMVEFAILTGIVILTDHLVKVIVRRSDVVTLWNKFKEFITLYI